MTRKRVGQALPDAEQSIIEFATGLCALEINSIFVQSMVRFDTGRREFAFIQVVIGMTFFIILTILTGYKTYMNSAASDWTLAPGHVRKVESKPKSADVIYEYTVDGRRYSGARFTFLPGGSIAERDEILTNYHAGDQIQVLVNPKQPSESVLIVRPSALPFLKNELFALSALVVFTTYFAFGFSFSNASGKA
jgi:hypothetical protein